MIHFFNQDLSAEIQQQIQAAAATRTPLRIVGGNSKAFLGYPVLPSAQTLDLSCHQGIVHYDPAELVITARTGTPLWLIEEVLAQGGRQLLAFEPPYFAETATLGGTIACNLSGPRRPWAGAARDSVLGVRLINGQGQILKFGGEVMKNVAGYDVSRLMAGAMGTLGVLLEISLKVLPRPAATVTLKQQCPPDQAIERMNALALLPWPLSALSYDAGFIWVRLEGALSAVTAAQAALGGEVVEDNHYWLSLREQQHPFFQNPGVLWRLAVKSTASLPDWPGHWLHEWGGALRWYQGTTPAPQIRQYAAHWGGHAMQFRHPDLTAPIFHPLADGLQRLQQRVKTAFDPQGLFNPGRLSAEGSPG